MYSLSSRVCFFFEFVKTLKWFILLALCVCILDFCVSFLFVSSPCFFFSFVFNSVHTDYVLSICFLCCLCLFLFAMSVFVLVSLKSLFCCQCKCLCLYISTRFIVLFVRKISFFSVWFDLIWFYLFIFLFGNLSIMANLRLDEVTPLSIRFRYFIFIIIVIISFWLINSRSAWNSANDQFTFEFWLFYRSIRRF